MENKILSLNQAQTKIELLKKKKKKVVLCHGVFDIIHPGHLEYFNYAKKLGHILVVSVTADKFVNKGFGRPIFDIYKRKLFLSNISIIDFVVESNHPSSVNIIKKLKPNLYIKGSDYKIKKNDLTGKIKEEIKAIKSVGGKFITSKGFNYSSSKMIIEHFSQDSEQKKFLNKLSKIYSKKQILDLINKLSKLNVLVIGESIIDEYIFCETIGKSGKEPVLNLRKLFSKKYLGGGLAICKNLSSFCRNISFLSYLGEKKDEKNFIIRRLPKNIKTFFVNKKNSSTIIKRRFLENGSNIKTLGVYTVNDDFLNAREESKIISKIKKLSKKTDLIIVSDYGHGLVTKKIAKLISSFKNKYYVNAQLNSNNLGNHNLENYKNPKAIVINENELRHEMRDKISNIEKRCVKLEELHKFPEKTLSSICDFFKIGYEKIITRSTFFKIDWLFAKNKKYFQPFNEDYISIEKYKYIDDKELKSIFQFLFKEMYVKWNYDLSINLSFYIFFFKKTKIEKIFKTSFIEIIKIRIIIFFMILSKLLKPNKEILPDLIESDSKP